MESVGFQAESRIVVLDFAAFLLVHVLLVHRVLRGSGQTRECVDVGGEGDVVCVALLSLNIRALACVTLFLLSSLDAVEAYLRARQSRD